MKFQSVIAIFGAPRRASEPPGDRRSAADPESQRPLVRPRKEIISGKAERPILREVFRQPEERSSRYVPLLIKLFPTAESRPRQREILIEMYRKGKITEPFRAFKKIYLEVVDQIIDHLKSEKI